MRKFEEKVRRVMLVCDIDADGVVCRRVCTVGWPR